MENKKQVKKQSKEANFIVQGSILAAAGILVRIIGMLYRIPMTNKIGDIGIGYYSAAFNIYNILLLISSYSMPTALSKMISVRLARREYRNAGRIMRAALCYATVAGGAGALTLWFGADQFAQALQMPYCSYALKSLAPTIWIMAYLGVLRGFFQGYGTMVPTAVSQILEQVVNAIISIVAAYSLFSYGHKADQIFNSNEYAYAYGAAGGTIGTGAGALTAFLFFLLIYYSFRPVFKRKIRRDHSRRTAGYGEITWIFCMTVFPIILSTAVYNVSSVADNYLFSKMMSESGMDSDSIASIWGIYAGKYHLLFNIPVAISNSLSSSLMPAITRAVDTRERGQVIEKVTSAIRFSMIVAIPSAVGLTVLAGPISRLLFNGDNTELTKMVTVGSVAVVFFSLSTVTNAVLQGINRMLIPIKNASIALALHLGILFFMVRFLKLEVYAVVYSNIIFALIVCILNGLSIRRYLRYRQEYVKTFFVPIASSLLMGGVVFGVNWAISSLIRIIGLEQQKILSRILSLPGILAAILTGALVYFVALIKFRGVGEAELYSMPKGTSLVRFARKLHLI